MSPAAAAFATGVRRHRLHMEVGGLAVLVFAASVAVGLRAHSRLTVARADDQRLQSVLTDIQKFEARFQPITPAERDRWAALPDSGALGVAPAQRLGLAETIARLAEQSGLEKARVSFGAVDSSVTPRQSVADGAAVLGDYTISVDCGGGFAQLLTFVNALPVSVSVAHLDGMRDPTHTRFHIVLAVYETKRANSS